MVDGVAWEVEASDAEAVFVDGVIIKWAGLTCIGSDGGNADDGKMVV